MRIFAVEVKAHPQNPVELKITIDQVKLKLWLWNEMLTTIFFVQYLEFTKLALLNLLFTGQNIYISMFISTNM